MKENGKEGVALITLVLVIIVMALLAVVPILTFSSLTKNSKQLKFAENMTIIEDAVATYYLGMGKRPLKSNATYTKNQLLALTSSDKQAALSAEITSNGDDTMAFYMIDIGKIALTQTMYGITENSENVFMNEDASHVYYIEGVKISNEWHFSESK